MLNDLTPDQVALMATVRDEWVGHGLSTQPADRAAAEAGVAQAYREAGLEPPAQMIWRDSPLAGCLAAAEYSSLGQGQARVKGRVEAQVEAQVWFQARAQVRSRIRSQVWSQVWGQVRSQVWGQVDSQVWDQVETQFEARVSRSSLGQHDAGYLAWADYYSRIGVHDTATGLMQVGRNAGWWWAFRDTVILTERPSTLHRDGQGRLHCETGPAIQYPDGWGIYVLHGVRVPADLIETGWTTEQVMREPNTEVRAAAIELIGWDKFTDQPGFTLEASADDPGNPGHTLDLYSIPRGLFDADVRLLLCHNASVERDGTRKRYGLTVPASITDPVAAAAWTFNLGPSEYRALVRAT